MTIYKTLTALLTLMIASPGSHAIRIVIDFDGSQGGVNYESSQLQDQTDPSGDWFTQIIEDTPVTIVVDEEDDGNKFAEVRLNDTTIANIQGKFLHFFLGDEFNTQFQGVQKLFFQKDIKFIVDMSIPISPIKPLANASAPWPSLELLGVAVGKVGQTVEDSDIFTVEWLVNESSPTAGLIAKPASFVPSPRQGSSDPNTAIQVGEWYRINVLIDKDNNKVLFFLTRLMDNRIIFSKEETFADEGTAPLAVAPSITIKHLFEMSYDTTIQIDNIIITDEPIGPQSVQSGDDRWYLYE